MPAPLPEAEDAKGDDDATAWLSPRVKQVLLMGVGPLIFFVLPDPCYAVALVVIAVLAFGGLRLFVSLGLRAAGLRIAFVVDERGAPILRLVRVGSPVRGLAAGALLVATDRINGGFFHRSVIVLTQHDASGSYGYTINLPLGGGGDGGRGGGLDGMRPPFEFEGGPPLRHALEVPEARTVVQHGVGGPVDIEPWGAAVLHRFGRGGRGDGSVLLIEADDAGAGADAGAVAAPRVRIGGELSVLRRFARDAVLAHLRTRPPGGRANGDDEPPLFLHVLHGHSAWAPGQLEGEIHDGAWEWAPGLGEDFAMRRYGRRDEVWLLARAAVAAYHSGGVGGEVPA